MLASVLSAAWSGWRALGAPALAPRLFFRLVFRLLCTRSVVPSDEDPQFRGRSRSVWSWVSGSRALSLCRSRWVVNIVELLDRGGFVPPTLQVLTWYLEEPSDNSRHSLSTDLILGLLYNCSQTRWFSELANGSQASWWLWKQNWSLRWIGNS